MKYRMGSIGRVAVARFEHGDEILTGLAEIAKRESIRAALFCLVGGVDEGRIVVGPESEVLPPTPSWREIQESHETMGIGTIFWHGEEPRVHFHGTYGKLDSVKAGCLREFARTFLVMEAVIMEIKDIDAKRSPDSLSNMILLDFGT